MKKSIIFYFLLFLPVMGLTAQGLVEDFDDGDLSGWGGSADYSLSNTGNALQIGAHKTSVWNSFTFSFTATDISANPYISLKIKTNTDFNLNFFINTDQAYGNAGKYQEIIHSDDFTEYVFDFSQAPAAILENASLLNFVFNPAGAQGCDATVFFEDLKIGSEASIMPKITRIEDQYHAINSATATVAFHGVSDLMDGPESLSLTASSSNTGLIPNPVVSFDPLSGTGTLMYTPVAGQVGSAVITLTVSGNAPADNQMTFNVYVENNLPPSLEQHSDVNIKAGVQSIIELKAIDDGNPNANQSVSLSATSSNTALVPDPVVEYNTGDYSARLILDPPAAVSGELDISVLLKDDGGTGSGGADSYTSNIHIAVYEDVNNPPSMAKIPDMSILQDEPEQSVELRKIDDGDPSESQVLQISASSSNPSLIPDPVIVYTQGSSTGQLKFTTVAGQTGTATITVIISDDGGETNNNGDESSIYQFEVEVRTRPILGWEDEFNDGILGPQWPAVWGDPGENCHLCVEEDGGMRIQIDKTRTNNRWAGLWFNIPGELNLSEYPYISITMKTDHPNTEMLIFLWDAYDHYNTNKTVRHRISGDYVEYYFDYSDPSFQLQGDGTPVDISRIKALLINFDPGGADPLFQGNFWFDDFRIGEQAHRLPQTPNVSINSIPDYSIAMNAGTQVITLGGIGDGADGSQTVTISATSNNTTLIPQLTAGVVSGGSAELSFTPASGQTGSATITVTAQATGSNSASRSFKVHVVELSSATAEEVSINTATEYQEIDGFGAFMGSGGESPDNIIDLAREMGMSMARFGVIGGGFERVNDNSDPYITDLSAYNLNALSIENMKRLAPFVDKFIVTFWSPAGWMKTNKWEDGVESWSTDNKLEPRHYQEYAEEVVALCRIVKRETGKDIYAIGLQNEPQFNEPYPSCQVDWNEYRDLINVVGPRLDAEGLGDVQLFWAEALPAQGRINDYINAVKNDATAHQYADIVAIHNYDADGASVGGAGCSEWSSILQKAQTPPGVYKTWMTETSGHADNWNGAMTLAGNIFNALECGNASAWVFWSFAVTEGSEQYGLVVANRPTSRYYVSKQYYKFIRPGAVRVEVNTEGIPSMAFLNKEKDSLSLILFNNTAETQTIRISGHGMPASWEIYTTSQSRNCEKGEDIGSDGLVILPPGSLSTLTGSISNPAPNIDQAGDVTIEYNSGPSEVILTGIDDGAGYTQSITITAGSDNPGFIPDPVISYNQGEATARLAFTPQTGEYGTALISVTLTDDGDPVGERTMQFRIKTKENPAPNINPVDNTQVYENSGSHLIMLSGINDGEGFSQEITITASSDNPGLIPDPTVEYTQGEIAAFLTFSPVSDMTGTATIHINLSDNGMPPASRETSFTITVLESTGIPEILQGFRIYPNPAVNLLRIETGDRLFSELRITDLSGRLLIEKNLNSTEGKYSVETEGLEKGMYILLLKNGSEVLSMRFIKE